MATGRTRAIAAVVLTAVVLAGALTLVPKFWPQAPAPATPEAVEAMIAASDLAALNARIKQSFPEDYRSYVDTIVQRRKEGATDAEIALELRLRLTTILRKHVAEGARASLAKLDVVARNQIALFRELADDFPAFCPAFFESAALAGLKQLPDKVRVLFRDSLTLRFDAIFEGAARNEPPPPVTREAAAEFDERLKRVGFSLAALQALTRNPTNPNDPGARCRTVETSLLVAAELGDEARRRILPPLLFPN